MVFPMFVGAAVFMWLGSILTRCPSQATIEKYFPTRTAKKQSEEFAPAMG